MRTKRVFFIIVCFIFLGNLVLAAGAADTLAGREEPFAFLLSLDEVSQLALENNLDIQIAKYDAYIQRTDIDRVKSVFDAVFTAGLAYEDDQSKSSSTLAGTKNTQANYNIGLSKKFASGTKIGVDLEDKRTFTNSSFSSLSSYHDARAGISLHQPLGNNFFGIIDRGGLKITKKQVENSDIAALDRIEQHLASAQAAYWLLALRCKQLEIEKEMLERAEALYRIFKEKEELGLVEQAELFAAEANVAERNDNVLSVAHEVLVAKNELLLALHEEDLSLKIITQDLGEDVYRAGFDLKSNLTRAVNARRDYLQAKNNIESNKIDLRMKKNALWPEIDLEASFLVNGLEGAQKAAWENVTSDGNSQWYAGVNVNLPLENNFAESDYRRAQLEKARALIVLKKTEHKIFVEITNALDEIKNKTEKIKLNEEIVKLQAKKLAFEEARFNSGRSNTDTLIRYQEDLLAAKLALALALYEYKLAGINLNRSQNVLLDKYWSGKL
ncbi:MAG: TolC family protein [Candidatus Omnitrophota bacterium]